MHQVIDKVKLKLGGFILGIQLNCFLKLVSGTLVLASAAQNETPNDPTLRIQRLLLNALADFLDGLDDIAFFEFCEGPVHVGVMSHTVELLGLPADVKSLLVDHVDVEEES